MDEKLWPVPTGFCHKNLSQGLISLSVSLPSNKFTGKCTLRVERHMHSVCMWAVPDLCSQNVPGTDHKVISNEADGTGTCS